MGTIQFVIPKPCHEDWNLMSPEEKGRFCGKCSRTVLDFSSKSSREIQEYIQEHEHEKLCGRFRNDQLKKPVHIEISYRAFVNQLNFSQSFYLALLIVFGTTFFSCTTHNNDIVGEIGLTDTLVADTTNTDTIVLMTTGLFFTKMDINDQDDSSELSQELVTSNEGNQFPDTIIDLPAVDINAEMMSSVSSSVMGGMYITRVTDGDTYGEVYETQDADSIETNIAEENIEQTIETSIVYPNPTHDIVNLKFNLSTDKMVGIELYDISGKLIRILKQSELMNAGESDIQMDLSELPPSTYLLRLVKGDQVESKRIVIQ